MALHAGRDNIIGHMLFIDLKILHLRPNGMRVLYGSNVALQALGV